MKNYQGSFTIEAACIMPIILFCICTTIEIGISLHQEIKEQVFLEMEKTPIDMVEGMYRKEFAKEILGEVYEN